MGGLNLPINELSLKGHENNQLIICQTEDGYAQLLWIMYQSIIGSANGKKTTKINIQFFSTRPPQLREGEKRKY